MKWAVDTGAQAEYVSHSCSVTAIAPYAFLTASHCIISDKLQIDGIDVSVKRVIVDGKDHSIYFISGLVFKNYVPVSLNTLEQGDEIFIFGNPGGHRDFFRKGYVMAIQNDSAGNAAQLDYNGFFGDSGSGVFNSKCELVGVVSHVEVVKREPATAQMKIMEAMDFAFRKSDYQQAYDFVP